MPALERLARWLRTEPGPLARPVLPWAAILKRLGFDEVRQRGSHKQFRHPDGKGTTVPFHIESRYLAPAVATDRKRHRFHYRCVSRVSVRTSPGDARRCPRSASSARWSIRTGCGSDRFRERRLCQLSPSAVWNERCPAFMVKPDRFYALSESDRQGELFSPDYRVIAIVLNGE